MTQHTDRLRAIRHGDPATREVHDVNERCKPCGLSRMHCDNHGKGFRSEEDAARAEVIYRERVLREDREWRERHPGEA